jgi:sorbitol/mannitol transport system substrate-binding protein
MKRSPNKMLREAVQMKRVFACVLVLVFGLSFLYAQDNKLAGQSISVAFVNNQQLGLVADLTSKFTEKTGIKVNIDQILENDLRQKLTVHAASGGGQYDIVNIGVFEASFWTRNGWLADMEPLFASMDKKLRAEYNEKDLLPAMVGCFKGPGEHRYGLPLFGEASCLFYNIDIVERQHGIKVPANPTWDDVLRIAKACHDPDKGVVGITMRGAPGWGMNGAVFGSMMHAYGGSWFDMNWKADYHNAAWRGVSEMYKTLLTKYGQKEPTTYTYTEANMLFAQGHAALFYDATANDNSLNTKGNACYNNTGYRPAPIAKKHADWMWTWGLGIDPNSKNKEAAFRYIIWVTGPECRDLMAKNYGWQKVFGAVRYSTNDNPEYKKYAPYATAIQKIIDTVDPVHPAVFPVPYSGNQFCGIPEFMSFGDQVAQYLADYVTDNISLDDFLTKSEDAANQAAIDGGYRK